MLPQQQSIDAKVRKLLAETLEKEARWKGLRAQGAEWDLAAADAGHSCWQLMQIVWANPLQLDTHRMLVSQLPFVEDDLPPYVHGLINQHGDGAVSSIETLLLRTDLDFGPYEVSRILDLLGGLGTNTSKMLPTPPGVEYSAEKVQYLQLRAPRELNQGKVAAVASKLLATFEPERPYKQPPYRSSDLSAAREHYSRYALNVAGLLALACRGEVSRRVPEEYCWCLSQADPFFGLHLFYGFLEPTQTQLVLRTIQKLADGKGRFLARSRDIPGAAEHLALSHLDNTDIGDISSLNRALLRAVDPKTREGAAIAFGILGGQEAVEALITALGDPWEFVREAAADALARIGSDALPPLLEAVRNGHHHNEEAYTEMMRRGGIPTRPWGDQRQIHWVQEYAAEALGKMRDDRAVDGLSTALYGEYSEWVRPSAAKALGAIGGPRAIDALRRAPRNVHPVVREAIAKALNAAEGKTGSP